MAGRSRRVGRWLSSLARRLGPRIRGEVLRLGAVHGSDGTWIHQHLAQLVPLLPEGEWSARVERRAEATQRLGRQPLWARYATVDGYGPANRPLVRTSDEVRASRLMGRFFAWLVVRRQPSVVVEFGAAFGVSGMYWLSGLEESGFGRLFSFEPNETWARIADENLHSIGTRFVLTCGTFEENLEVLGSLPIDIAFIDAIHTSAFVEPQFELVAQRLRPGGLVLLDDIDFSPDMSSCWKKLREDGRVVASAEIDRVGLVELG
jgi:predicted O-methyltransferase YrrM